ncbi:MAG: dTMP kinase [Clostridia bacterium]|nr:dTMP kinase [Clostridia bacterium]
MERGKFIVFEGIDGSGKSTHARLLKERLEREGYRVFLTLEPTEGEAGKLLRRCLTGESDLPEEAIAGLFMTDRLDHIKNPANGILAHLERGEIVISDRYYFSSFAYNSMYAPMEWVIAINALARKLLKPDLTLFLDLDPERFDDRIRARGQKERYEKEELLRNVRENYMKAFSLLPDEKVEIVDNGGGLEEAAEKVYAAARKILG